MAHKFVFFGEILVIYAVLIEGDLNEVASNNGDDRDDNDDDDYDDDDDANIADIGTGEALTMIYRLVNLKYLSKEERNSCGHERQIRENNSVEQKAISMIIFCWNKVCIINFTS